MKSSCQPLARHAALFALLLLLDACGGGERPADVVPSAQFADPPVPVSGPDSFLLWPNSLSTPDGSPPKIDSPAYALAYYAAVDPGNLKDSLSKWKTANGFSEAGGIEASVTFGDFRDLGYGRRMSGRCDADPAQPTRCSKNGRVAFVVENFLVNPSGDGYGATINLDAAMANDRRWIVSINAIDFAPGPNGSVRFARFYSFDTRTGARRLTQNLDGRGEKALPGACISCHGGRADALAPDGSGGWQMPLLQRSQPEQRGDVRGRFHPFEVDALTFAGAQGATAEQEAALKTLNKMVLCTYPLGPASSLAEYDACRDAAVVGEWQGGAAQVIIDAYAGATPMSSPTYRTPPVPADWRGSLTNARGTVVKSDLYSQVVAPSCLGCHRLLGSDLQDDIDFASFAKFAGYDPRTRELVFDRGNMPLSRITFQRFWSSAPADRRMARQLADYLSINAALSVPRNAAGDPRSPGAPVALAGPDRRIAVGETRLSAKNSLYADSYQWTLVSAPAGVTLADTTTMTARLTATSAAAGQRAVVRLVASRGGVASDPALVTLYVNAPADGYPDPTQVRYAQVKPLLSACISCHSTVGTPKLAFQAGSDDEVYATLRGLVNFDNLASSQLLRKPSGEHHGGGPREGYCLALAQSADPAPAPCSAAVAAPVPVGSPLRRSLDTFTDWAVAGAPR